MTKLTKEKFLKMGANTLGGVVLLGVIAFVGQPFVEELSKEEGSLITAYGNKVNNMISDLTKKEKKENKKVPNKTEVIEEFVVKNIENTIIKIRDLNVGNKGLRL